MEATSFSTTSMAKIMLLVLMILVNLLVAAADQAAAITREDNTQDEATNLGVCAAECAAACRRSHKSFDDHSASTNIVGALVPIVGRVIPYIPKIIPKIIPRKPLPGIPKRKPDLPDIPIPDLPGGGQGDPDSCYAYCLNFQCKLTPNPSSLYRCTAGCAYHSVTQLTDADADQVQSYVDSCKRECQEKN